MKAQEQQQARSTSTGPPFSCLFLSDGKKTCMAWHGIHSQVMFRMPGPTQGCGVLLRVKDPFMGRTPVLTCSTQIRFAHIQSLIQMESQRKCSLILSSLIQQCVCVIYSCCGI